jgi:hypothetical protein
MDEMMIGVLPFYWNKAVQDANDRCPVAINSLPSPICNKIRATSDVRPLAAKWRTMVRNVGLIG